MTTGAWGVSSKSKETSSKRLMIFVFPSAILLMCFPSPIKELEGESIMYLGGSGWLGNSGLDAKRSLTEKELITLVNL